MKKNIRHLKTNWLQNFDYFVGHCPSFKQVKSLVEEDRFEEALRKMDSIRYRYSDGLHFQTIRNGLINMTKE